VTAYSDGPNKGSEFVVTLPALVEAARTGPSELTARHAPTPRRVLVVDDNVDAAESSAVLLRMDGHEVRLAHNGMEALQAASEFQPEIILLDIGLPGINGYEVARRLRQQPQFEKTLLIAITGYGQDEDRRRSREAGFNHHLTKPVDPVSLQALVAV